MINELRGGHAILYWAASDAAATIFHLRLEGSRLMKYLWQCLFVFFFLMVSHHAFGGVADVIDAKAVCNQNSTCDFSVTVQHEDSGWDHFANQWEVLSLDGEILGVRVLHHPHVNEQPFTRSLTGVSIPPSIKTVRFRARDSVHGYGGKEVIVELER